MSFEVIYWSGKGW